MRYLAWSLIHYPFAVQIRMEVTHGVAGFGSVVCSCGQHTALRHVVSTCGQCAPRHVVVRVASAPQDTVLAHVAKLSPKTCCHALSQLCHPVTTVVAPGQHVMSVSQSNSAGFECFVFAA